MSYNPLQRHEKWKINSLAFNKINNEEKSYFLGFMYADGTVIKECNEVRLRLQEKDKEMVEKFRIFLGHEKPLVCRNPTKGQVQSQWEVSFNDHQIHSDLIRLGCWPHKTKYLLFPTEQQVPKNLIHHFIRGYFDGDGCMHQFSKKESQWNISICVTKEFGERLQEIIKNETKCSVRLSKHKTANIYILYVSGAINCFLFANYMYNNSTIFLQRKNDIFKKLKIWFEKICIGRKRKSLIRRGIIEDDGLVYKVKYNKYRPSY